jgi:hypothetical protein
MEDKTSAWDKSIDSKAKWSSDLDYIARYNWFVGNAQIMLANSWNTETYPNALLDSLYFMEGALNDCYVLVALDTFNPVKHELLGLEASLIENTQRAIRLKGNGNAGPYIEQKRKVSDLFLRVREVGHKAGLDLKQQMNIERTAGALQKLIGEPKL